jgi:hypothetical protein
VHARADARHAHLLPLAAALLCASLDGLLLPPLAPGAPGHVLSVRYATEHRAGVVLRGPGLCDRVTGTGASSARLVAG